MDSLSLHRGGWRDARVVLQALFAELAVYLNRAGGWAAQAPTTDLRTPPPTSRSPTRTKQPICRCNNIPRHFLRPTMIEFALLFTCFRKLGPGFRKPSAGPVDHAPAKDGGTSKASKRTSRRRTTQPQTHHRRRHGNNKFLFGSHCEAKLAERSH